MEDYVVRPFEPRDEEDVVSLIIQVFKGWLKYDYDCSPKEHYRWKYLDTPVRRGIPASVALKGGEIVGCFHDFQSILKLGDSDIYLGKGSDLAVHPDHRRHGLYHRMTLVLNRHRLENDIALTLNISDNPIVVERAKKRNRPMLRSPVLRVVRIRDIDLHLRQYPEDSSLVVRLGVKFLKTVKRLTSVAEISGDLELKRIKKFGVEISEYYNAVKSRYNFISAKSPQYLNWRFCDRRGGNYRVTGAYEAGVLAGYIVYRVNRINPEYLEGYILGFQYLPDRLDVAGALLAETVDYLDSENVNIVVAWALRNQQILKVFGSQGFLNSRKDQLVFMHPLKPGLDLDPLMNSPIDTVEFNLGYTDSN
jgi:hypothetical protein